MSANVSEGEFSVFKNEESATPPRINVSHIGKSAKQSHPLLPCHVADSQNGFCQLTKCSTCLVKKDSVGQREWMMITTIGPKQSGQSPRQPHRP